MFTRSKFNVFLPEDIWKEDTFTMSTYPVLNAKWQTCVWRGEAAAVGTTVNQWIPVRMGSVQGSATAVIVKDSDALLSLRDTEKCKRRVVRALAPWSRSEEILVLRKKHRASGAVGSEPPGIPGAPESRELWRAAVNTPPPQPVLPNVF